VKFSGFSLGCGLNTAFEGVKRDVREAKRMEMLQNPQFFKKNEIFFKKKGFLKKCNNFKNT